MTHKDSYQNLKYLNRCTYYGKLIDWDYVEGAMVLKLRTYTATEYFGGSNTIRLYVPTDIERRLAPELIVGDNYFCIAAPYKLTLKQRYKHRVDLLLNIFKEVI